MTSTPDPKTPGEGTSHVKTRTPRPDELSREAFEFIAAIDEYKRQHLRSFLDDSQVLSVAHELGWYPADTKRFGAPTKAELAKYAEARESYRAAHGRLFPTWSEVFQLLVELGYRRKRAA